MRLLLFSGLSGVCRVRRVRALRGCEGFCGCGGGSSPDRRLVSPLAMDIGETFGKNSLWRRSSPKHIAIKRPPSHVACRISSVL